jgi:type IX secretion system PorP/SprF family membrane protein
MKHIHMKKMIWAALLFVSVLAGAQDVHFSQFMAAPQQLSPAMTGVFPGKFRFAASYRNQWASVFATNPYKTITAGLDARFFAFKHDYLAVGLKVLSDEAGDSQFNQKGAHLSLAYLKQLSGNGRLGTSQFLTAGGQVGYVQQGINWDNLKFSAQFDGEDYNSTLATGENMNNTRASYLDVNAGLMWYAVFEKNRSLYAGGAVSHVTQPVVSFLDGANDGERTYMRFNVYGGGQLPLSDNFSLLPQALFMKQGPTFQVNAGVGFRYTNRDWNEVAFRLSGATRVTNRFNGGILNDAVIVGVGLELQDWQLGLSYDVNTSSLKSATNGRGGYELSLIYVYPEPMRKRLDCPTW